MKMETEAIEKSKKRKRARNFSAEEELVLLELVGRQRNILENKKSDAATWKQKEQTWKRVADLFTAQTGSQRPWAALREKFDAIKRKAKIQLQSGKTQIHHTGVGPSYAIGVTEKITTALGDSSAGLGNMFDSDSCCISEENTIGSVCDLKEEVQSDLEGTADSGDLPDANRHHDLAQKFLEWSTWNSKSSQQLMSMKSKSDDPGSLKRSLEEEKLTLTLLQQDFYKAENARAEEKHQLYLLRAQEKHTHELIAIKLKNKLLHMEVLDKKAKLNLEYNQIK